MKVVAIVLLSMSLLTRLFGDNPKKDTWAIAKITSPDGEAGLFRYRENLPSDERRTKLTEEISISWKFDGAMPDKATTAPMGEFEAALAPLISGSSSDLMFVATFAGRREWCFYAQDYADFMKLLNACLRGKPRLPLIIEHTRDPEWKYWHSFTDGIQKK